MSVHAISWVLKHSEAKLGDRLVLIVLADHASSDGGDSYPSVATISREARMSSRQVQRSLYRLREAGAIRVTGRSAWKTTVYEIVMDKLSPNPSLDTSGSSNGSSFLEDVVKDGLGDKSDTHDNLSSPVLGNVCRECGTVLNVGETECPCSVFAA